MNTHQFYAETLERFHKYSDGELFAAIEEAARRAAAATRDCDFYNFDRMAKLIRRLLTEIRVRIGIRGFE